MMIETANLRLVPCDLVHFEAILKNEKELATLLHVELAEEWLGFAAAKEAMAPAYEHLKSYPSLLGWWTYLFIHVADSTLIGLGGFKGAPDASGAVEIGYAIAPSYRRRGLATEAARGMIDYAFSHEHLTRVVAHTLPEKNPSTMVLQKVGMKFRGSTIDPDDGEVWSWSLSRNENQRQ